LKEGWYTAAAATLVSTVFPLSKVSGDTAGTELQFVTYIHDVSERLGQIKLERFRGVEKISRVTLNAGPPGSGYPARTYSEFKIRPFQVPGTEFQRPRACIHGLVFIFVCKNLVTISLCIS